MPSLRSPATPPAARRTAAARPRESGVLGFVAFRVGLVLYAVFVPGFWVWYRPDLTGVVDPLGLRLALAAAAVAVLGGTYVSGWVRRHVIGLFTGLLYLLTAWFFPLVCINGLDADYVIGILLITVSSAFGLAVMGTYEGRVERLRWYLAFSFAWAVAVSLFAPEPEIARGQFVATVGVILAMAHLCASVSRSAESRLAQSEVAARASDERFRRVFENVHDVLFEIDAQGRWLLLSPSWMRLTGFSVEGSIGRSFLSVVSEPDRRETVERAEELFRRGDEVCDEAVRIRTARGEVRWVNVRARLTYGPDGAATGAAGTLADVTDSFRAQAEREARERAEELLRVKSSFLSNMSHELRTPLTGILGFAELLEAEVEGEPSDFARLIHTSARRLLGTVNSVLDLAQLEGRGLRLRPERLDVAAEIAEGVRLLRPLADQKGIGLRVHGGRGGLVGEVDPHALHRIVTNLVGNAIKFTDRGGVAVRADADPERLWVTVEDTGVGIPAEVIPKLFEPFRQASEGLARKHEGNGLGLTITKQIVDLMGGEVAVESEVGRGTRFVVTIPRWASASGRGGGGDGHAAPPAGPGSVGTKDLVAAPSA